MMNKSPSNINRLEQVSTNSSMDLQVDSSLELAVLTFYGSVTLDLINGAFLKLIDHPSFVTNMNACYDYSAAIIEVSIRDLEAHSDFVLQNLKRRGSRYKLAFVSNESLNTALLNVYKVKVSKSDAEARLFARKKAAIHWLTDNSKSNINIKDKE